MSETPSCSFCNRSKFKVEYLLEGPDHNGSPVYTCNHCVTDAYHVIQKLKQKPTEDVDLTPSVILERIDSMVVGQDTAKKIISIAVYNHMLRVSNPGCNIGKPNVMLIGPSGSGKTLIVKTIASMLEIPYTIVSATSLSETGYIGTSADEVVAKLYQVAGKDIELTQRGIIFIDEVDKIAKKDTPANRDISGEGVQQSLLTMMEGSEVTIRVDNREVTIDTSNILFIASGAFVGLDKIIQQRTGEKRIGFGTTVSDASTVIAGVEPDDLLKFGMIPEFVGRLPVIATLTELTVAELRRILVEPDNSITRQYKELFGLHGISIEFDDEYLDSVARVCIEKKTGARGLRRILESALLETQFVLPDMASQKITKVVVHGDGTIESVPKKKRQINNITK